MSSSLEPILRRIQAALQQATVAGTAHAKHALQEAASTNQVLREVGLHALAEQLASLAGGDDAAGGRDPSQAARALAEALRSVELALAYLLRLDEAPRTEGLAWPDDSVLVEAVPDLHEAIYAESDLQWAWALQHNCEEMAQASEWLLGLAGEGNVGVRRRAIEALSYVPSPSVIGGLARHLGDDRVARAVVDALVRLGVEREAYVALALLDLLQAGAPSGAGGRVALTLYRLGVFGELSRFREHPDHIVRCYAGMAGDDGLPDGESLPDDALAQHIVRGAVEDRSGVVSEDLLKSCLGLQKQTLGELCFYVADTPTGERLLDYARRLMSGRTPRARRQKACLVLGILGDARDVPRLTGPASAGLPEAFQALGLLGGEAVYRTLSEAVEGRQFTGGGSAIHALGELGDLRAVPQLISLLKNPLHDRMAATALAAIGAREAVPHLIARLGRAQPFEAGTYVEALIRIDDPAAVDGFVETLVKSTGRLRAAQKALVRGLIHFGDHSVDEMVGLLSHQDTRIRAVAEEVLTCIRTERSQEALDRYLQKDPVQHLLAQLTYGSVEVRQQAARDLGEMSGPELAELLDKALGGGGEGVTLEEGKALLKAVEGLHFPEVVPPLRALVADEQVGLAKTALATLSSFPYVVNRPTLMNRLQTRRVTEVRRAAQMLGQQDMTVVDDVVGHLASDDPHLRGGALTVLGAKRARWAADLVMPLLDDPHPRVRLALATYITQLSVPHLEEAIISSLVPLLDSASDDVLASLVASLQVLACGSARDDVHDGLVLAWRRQGRHASRVLEAIGAVAHPEARSVLLAQLGSPTTAAVQGAVTGLAHLGDPGAFPALERAFDQVSTTPLFRALHEGLTRLSEGWHRLFRARQALARANPQAALAELEGYVADNPSNGDGYLERARALHMSGRISAAYDDYLRASQHLSRSSVVWHSAALAAQQMGDLETASKHFDQALQTRRDDGGVRLRRGLLRLEKLDYRGALADFRAAMGPRVTVSPLHKRVAGLLVDVVSLFDDAPPDQPPSKVQLLNSMDRPLPNRLADLVLIWALILVRRLAEARQCLDRFEERWPESRSYGLLNAAWLYAVAGETARAQEALDDLEAHAVTRGYHWPHYVRYAFSDWPVVCESLTNLLLEASRE